MPFLTQPFTRHPLDAAASVSRHHDGVSSLEAGFVADGFRRGSIVEVPFGGSAILLKPAVMQVLNRVSQGKS